MKDIAGKIFGIVMALAICMASAYPAVASVYESVLSEQTHQQPETADSSAAPMDPVTSGADVVYNAAELSDWLAKNTEGRVTLGRSIELTALTFFYGPVTIDTGVYGLTFNGGYLAGGFIFEGEVANPVLDKITIIGDGVGVPVVNVHNMGRMFIGDWNNYLYTLSITAVGRDGTGGTALCISGSGSGMVSLSNLELEEPGLIRSVGAGAIGIELMEPFDLFFFNVEAEGENSAAVHAHADASVNFCKLSASGSGAMAVGGGGEITVDTCITEPFPTQGNVSVYQAEPFPLWYPVAQGSEKEVLNWWMLESVSLIHSGSVIRGLEPSVTWDTAAYDAISFDEPGITSLSGALDSSWLRELLPGAPEMIVAVRDPEVPCIRVIGNGEDCHILYFWTCDAWGPEDCILWISDDGGEAWRDCTEDDGVVWKENNVAVPESMIGEGVMFVIEVPGFGFSNVAHFSYEYGQFVGDIGGDRVGTDRISVSLGGEKPIGSDGQQNNPTDPDEVETGGSTVIPGNPGNGTGNPVNSGGSGQIPVNPTNTTDPPGSDESNGGAIDNPGSNTGGAYDNVVDDKPDDTTDVEYGIPDTGNRNDNDSVYDTDISDISDLPVPIADAPSEDGDIAVHLPAQVEAVPAVAKLPATADLEKSSELSPANTPVFHAASDEPFENDPEPPAEPPVSIPEELLPLAQPTLSKKGTGAGVAIAITSAVILVAVCGWLLPSKLRVFRK